MVRSRGLHSFSCFICCRVTFSPYPVFVVGLLLGIIHPATHGNAEGEIIVLDETAMFKKIFLYVDRCVGLLTSGLLFRIVYHLMHLTHHLC
jgi:hypothetical protein